MIVDPQARIADKKSWGNYFLLSFESSGIASNSWPGQFIMVRISSHPYPLLRRPFSIHSKDERHIEIFFKVAGTGTALLSQKKTGESVDILGPLGKGFSLDAVIEGEKVAVVGGGRGIAPLYFLARELRKRRFSPKIFYGGKSLEDLPLKEKFEREGLDISFSTDDGSCGYKGFVSDFLREELEKLSVSRIFACGPEAMMKKISLACRERNIRAEFSLESQMGCGFGVCWGCIKRIRKKGKAVWTKVCEEGPVFSAEDIIWPEGEE